jgi:hypothetical protein
VTPDSIPGQEPAEEAPGKKKKKREKVRSVWISFTGRIIAQIAGAAATIILGLFIVSKYHETSLKEREAPARP